MALVRVSLGQSAVLRAKYLKDRVSPGIENLEEP
jgi:hypothetical protein